MTTWPIRVNYKLKTMVIGDGDGDGDEDVYR